MSFKEVWTAALPDTFRYEENGTFKHVLGSFFEFTAGEYLEGSK